MTWIKTSEKIPEDREWCWIFCPPCTVIWGNFNKESLEWRACEDGFVANIKMATHWKPLIIPSVPMHDV